MFGTDRILAVLRTHRQETPEVILDTLFGAVNAFAHHPPQEDDMTAVVIQIGAGW
jgi:serine phosphatase RsbU (regulator of sigma subunit)